MSNPGGGLVSVHWLVLIFRLTVQYIHAFSCISVTGNVFMYHVYNDVLTWMMKMGSPVPVGSSSLSVHHCHVYCIYLLQSYVHVHLCTSSIYLSSSLLPIAKSKSSSLPSNIGSSSISNTSSVFITQADASRYGQRKVGAVTSELFR